MFAWPVAIAGLQICFSARCDRTHVLQCQFAFDSGAHHTAPFQQAPAHALHCVNATCATHVLPFNALDLPSAHAILVFADQLAAVLQHAVAKPHR